MVLFYILHFKFYILNYTMLPQSSLADLYALQILDTDSECAFENLVELASLICGTGEAYINFIDKNRQWTKAVWGAERGECNLNDSFCVHTVQSGRSVFIVDKPESDHRFRDKVLVKIKNGIRYYAGVPVVSASGHAIGALCVVSRQHHRLSDDQLAALKLLGSQVNLLLKERADTNQLEEAKKRAEAKATIQNLLTSLAAHELKNPLNTILLLLDVLTAKGMDKDQFLQSAESTRIQLRNLATGIDDILDLSKRMVYNGAAQKEFGSIAQSLQSLIDLNVSQLAAKNNKVLFSSVIREEVFTDLSGVMLIVGNLLSNANKFTENGIIRISAKKTKNTICIQVQDTGRGMDPTTVAAINNGEFLHPSRGTKQEKGLGVGLLFARQYLEMKNGSLSVQSGLGKGTTFTLLINDVQFVKPAPLAAA